MQTNRKKYRLIPIIIAAAIVAVVVPGLAQDPRALQLLLQNRAELAHAAAPTLARWIEASRRQALAEGVKPIPPSVRRRLTGYYPAELLNRVHYRVGLAKAASLPVAAFEYGHTIAMTLDDVIVFRDPQRAEMDASLWAHELRHVMQFRSWGVARFAETYLADWESVETEARTAASEFDIWEEVQKTKALR